MGHDLTSVVRQEQEALLVGKAILGVPSNFLTGLWFVGARQPILAQVTHPLKVPNVTIHHMITSRHSGVFEVALRPQT